MSDPKQPLSAKTLREIALRRPGDDDVMTLLWEIKRLRDESEQLKKDGQRDYSIISRCYQIARSLLEKEKGGTLGLLIADLNDKLEGHPVKEYQDSILPYLLGKDLDKKPGDDDEY